MLIVLITMGSDTSDSEFQPNSHENSTHQIMDLINELQDVFGQENLAYALPERLNAIEMPDKTREVILNIGLPNLIGYFRFSMDFEALSDDIQIGKSTKSLGRLFTIGCKGATQLIGRHIQLQAIGLPSNASLNAIGQKIKLLGLDNAIFSSEVNLAPRICVDFDRDGEIRYINPTDLSILFLNSNIEKLAASLIFYHNFRLTEQDFATGLGDFKKRLDTIDPKALENQENVWAIIIEQLMLDEEGY
jgi:hypothetical protein